MALVSGDGWRESRVAAVVVPGRAQETEEEDEVEKKRKAKKRKRKEKEKKEKGKIGRKMEKIRKKLLKNLRKC